MKLWHPWLWRTSFLRLPRLLSPTSSRAGWGLVLIKGPHPAPCHWGYTWTLRLLARSFVQRDRKPKTILTNLQNDLVLNVKFAAQEIRTLASTQVMKSCWSTYTENTARKRERVVSTPTSDSPQILSKSSRIDHLRYSSSQHVTVHTCCRVGETELSNSDLRQFCQKQSLLHSVGLTSSKDQFNR